MADRFVQIINRKGIPMYQVDFNHPVHIYFIGIGGISMSGLAEILLSEGFRVSGSDAKNHLLPNFWKNRVLLYTTDSAVKI